ncbi:MAG: DUF3276 family protein [Treponema sp.]|nr:DUF3276 family protein [Treponema sp.]
MGARGELFTTEVYLDNRSYFFNVKENRNGDVFLQVVESKNRDGGEGDRHQIAIFADDMKQFLNGLDTSLSFIEKDRRTRLQKRAEIMAERTEKVKKVYRMQDEKRNRNDGIKRTGRVHIVSKRPTTESE